MKSSNEGACCWEDHMADEHGGMLLGFGAFNLVEGILDHQLLGLHHVNERVPREQWIYWDLAFLVWGAAMLIGGWLLLKRGKQEMHARAEVPVSVTDDREICLQ